MFAKIQTWDLVKIKRPAVHSLPRFPSKKKWLLIIFDYVSNRSIPNANDFALNLHTNQAQSEKESSSIKQSISAPSLEDNVDKTLNWYDLTLLKFLLFKTTEKCHPIKNHSV